MKYKLGPKEKKRIDLVVEPVKSGQWEQVLKWKYYDQFKMGNQRGKIENNVTFDPSINPNASQFIRQ